MIPLISCLRNFEYNIKYLLKITLIGNISWEDKMVVVAANVTDETVSLLEELIETAKFVRFTEQNHVNLKDKTILIRLALINLSHNLPSTNEVSSYKAALLRPTEFDSYLRKILEEK